MLKYFQYVRFFKLSGRMILHLRVQCQTGRSLLPEYSDQRFRKFLVWVDLFFNVSLSYWWNRYEQNLIFASRKIFENRKIHFEIFETVIWIVFLAKYEVRLLDRRYCITSVHCASHFILMINRFIKEIIYQIIMYIITFVLDLNCLLSSRHCNLKVKIFAPGDCSNSYYLSDSVVKSLRLFCWRSSSRLISELFSSSILSSTSFFHYSIFLSEQNRRVSNFCDLIDDARFDM